MWDCVEWKRGSECGCDWDWRLVHQDVWPSRPKHSRRLHSLPHSLSHGKQVLLTYGYIETSDLVVIHWRRWHYTCYIVGWGFQSLDRLAEKRVRVLWALQEPVDPEKLSDEWTPLTNDRIDLYNDLSRKVRPTHTHHSIHCDCPGISYLPFSSFIISNFPQLWAWWDYSNSILFVIFQVLRYSKADIWSSSRLIALENIADTPDGYHLGSKTIFHDVQVTRDTDYFLVDLIWV